MSLSVLSVIALLRLFKLFRLVSLSLSVWFVRFGWIGCLVLVRFSLGVLVGVKMRDRFAELWFRVRLNSVDMPAYKKTWFWLNIVFGLALFGWIVWLFASNSVENCWSKYSVEEQAILVCEDA